MIIIIIASLLFLTIRLIGFDGLYGQDAYEYLRYTKSISNYIATGNHPGDYFWPLYYPIFGALFSLIFNNEIVSLQLISIISLLGSCYYIIKIICLKHKEPRYIYGYVLLFFLASPYVLRLSLSVMSDMLSVFFITSSFYYGLLFLKENTSKPLYLCAILAIASVMTRYASGVVLFPLFIYISYYVIKTRKLLLHLIPILLITLLMLLPHIIIRYSNVTQFINHTWLSEWGITNFFKSQFETQDGIQQYKFINIFFNLSNVFHPAYCFLGFFLLLFFKKEDFKLKQNALFYSSILIYFLFLSGTPFQNRRFLILTFPLILIVLYPLFLRVLDYTIIKKNFKIIFTFLLAIQLFLNYKALKPVLDRSEIEKIIVEHLKPYQKNTLYTFDIDIALQGRSLDFNYKNMLFNFYENLNENDLVLFHPTKFVKQWENSNIIYNWENINKQYTLKVLEDLPDGWKLYQIETKENSK